jgi:hypothetical protein
MSRSCSLDQEQCHRTWGNEVLCIVRVDSQSNRLAHNAWEIVLANKAWLSWDCRQLLDDAPRLILCRTGEVPVTDWAFLYADFRSDSLHHQCYRNDA